MMKYKVLCALLMAMGLAACSQTISGKSETASAKPEIHVASQTAASAAKSAALDAQSLGERIMTYYQQADDEKGSHALDILNTGVNHFSQQANPSGFRNLSAWAAQILIQHPEYTEHWCRTLIERNQHQLDSLIAVPFKLANTPESLACMNTQLKLDAETRKNIDKQIPLNNVLRGAVTPASLDARWASFFATGDAQYVQEIVDYVIQNADILDKKPEKPTLEDAMHWARFGAARWSLSSNMHQFPDVKRIVEEYAAKQPETQQKILNNILKENTK